MARKKKFIYFDAFNDQFNVALQEADLLVEILDNYVSAESIADILDNAHEIECAGDSIKHKTYEAIAVDFFTPFDREDILDITSSLDDITDELESAVRMLYMLDVHVVHPSCKKLAEYTIECLKALRAASKELPDFKRSKKFRHAMEKDNDFEERADNVYLESMRGLFADESDDPIHVIKWSRIFDKLEDCCDACGHVCDVMGSVVLKNS